MLNRPDDWFLPSGSPGLLLSWQGADSAVIAEKNKRRGEGDEVGTVEDLMREHGVLRRALLVYIETVPKLRSNAANLDAHALARTAKLFRSFGEDYHERKLEEVHIFPAVRKVDGPAAAYVDVLVAQHNRGREITDYILTVAGKGDIERQTFGKDGFEDAVKEIAQIEHTLGFADLAQFTAPAPPRA